MRPPHTDGPRCYTPLGDLLPVREWGVLWELGPRQLGVSLVPGGWVSTVWLGLDRAPLFLRVEPLIFESMHFAGDMDHTADVVGSWHWRSLGEAARGHRQVVDDLRGVRGQARHLAVTRELQAARRWIREWSRARVRLQSVVAGLMHHRHVGAEA